MKETRKMLMVISEVGFLICLLSRLPMYSIAFALWYISLELKEIIDKKGETQ